MQFTTRIALRQIYCCSIAIAAGMLPNSAKAQLRLPSAARPADSSAATRAAGTAAAAANANSIRVSPGSPRASLTAFLTDSRNGDFTDAARYLDLAPAQAADGALLARRLKLVLDQYVWLEPNDISAAAAGDTTDGLPAGVDQVGAIRTDGGAARPVRLVRFEIPSAEGGSETIWRFSRGTIGHIPEWYATLGDHWLIDRLPPSLLRSGPFDLLWWQWAATIPLAVVAIFIGMIVGRVVRGVLTVAARRTTTAWDNLILARIREPLTAFCALIAGAALLPLLHLYAPAAAAVYRLLRIGFAIVVFWSIWRLIDIAGQVLAHMRWAVAMPASRSLIPLGARITKVLVAVLALVAILTTLGYPVTTLIAGLGIGGLALALAAQKTVENLFGAFSIGIDQPFLEGDFVHVDDFVGTVEAIGLRSTRFRTLDRTIVSLPNGRLADMRLESFAVRDRLRLSFVLGLVYETTGAQMRAVLAALEAVLRAHPKIWPDAVVVRFGAFAPSSLNIDIMAWFQTSDWGEFQLIRQDILLAFMDVVEGAGSSFALPTTTVHLAPSQQMDPGEPRGQPLIGAGANG